MITLRRVFGNEDAAKHIFDVAQVEGHVQAVIDIQANEITGTFDVARISVEQTERKPKLAMFDQPQKCLVEGFVQQVRNPAVEHRGHRLKHNVVLRPSDLRMRLELVNRAIGQQVALRENAGNAQSSRNFTDAAGGKLSENVAGSRVHVWFVEGHPAIAEVAEPGDDEARKTLKLEPRIRIQKCALLLEPAWISEVVQADDRANPASMKSLKKRAVAIKGFGAPLPSSGSIRLHSTERRSAFTPIACARSKSGSAFSPVAGRARSCHPSGCVPGAPIRTTGNCRCCLQPGRKRSKLPEKNLWGTSALRRLIPCHSIFLRSFSGHSDAGFS